MKVFKKLNLCSGKTQTGQIYAAKLCQYKILLIYCLFTEFLQSTKENLADREIIIGGDFAENYSFIAQDAAQGFYWNRNSATIHPLNHTVWLVSVLS